MFIIFTIILIVIDQVTKIWTVNTFPLGGTGQYVGLGFYFTYVQNTGAAFGILQGISIPIGPMVINGTRLLGLLSLVVSIFIFAYIMRNRKDISLLQQSALTLILAGALGNMIDRFRLSYVIDFIHFNTSWLNFPVFNIADSCVVIGAGLLILSSLFTPEPKAKEKITDPYFESDYVNEEAAPLTNETQKSIS